MMGGFGCSAGSIKSHAVFGMAMVLLMICARAG